MLNGHLTFLKTKTLSSIVTWGVLILMVLLLGLTILAQIDQSQLNDENIKTKYLQENSQFIEVNNMNIHVIDSHPRQIHQAKQLETLVLIHGTASSLHTWDPWVSLIDDSYRVIRLDLPGFGLTGHDPNGQYEIQDDVFIINKLLEKLNVENAHIIGSSLGGRIAWQYSLEFPNQTRSLTLINALGYPQDSWPPAIQMGQIPMIDQMMKYLTSRLIFKISLQDIYADHQLITEKTIDRYFELAQYGENPIAFPQRVKARLDKDAELIKRIQTPTLILWGQKDRFFPVANAYQFNKDILGSKLKVFSDVGHLPMEEAPKASIKEFLNFITQLKH